jgi:hypothetical protein
MNVLIVEFGLTGMTAEELISASPDIAPDFANIPGCLEKTWLADGLGGSFGGVYKFQDRESLDAYVASELFEGVRSHPAFTNVTARAFDVMERATEITHGLPKGAAVR